MIRILPTTIAALLTIGLLLPAAVALAQGDDADAIEPDPTRPTAPDTTAPPDRPTTAISEETFFAAGAQKVRFKGEAWMGWAGDLTEGHGFPNQFFINRIDIRFEGNLDSEGRFGFRVRLETGPITATVTDPSDGSTLQTTVDQTGGGYLYVKQAYFQIFRFLLSDDKLQIGATALPWVPFAEDMFGYRILRASAPELWGYQTPSDLGITHYLFFDDKLVTVQYGIWNGDYTAKGIDAFGNGENISDFFKVVGLQVIFRDKQTPFRATIAFMLQSESGDDPRDSNGNLIGVNGIPVHSSEDGFRVFGGLYYKSPRDLTLGLTFGLIAQRGPQDALSAFLSFFTVVNLSVVSPDLDHIEVVFRFDVGQLDFKDPTRNEPGNIKFMRPDGSLRFGGIDLVNNTEAENLRFLGGWEFAVTFGVAIRVHSLVTIIVPAFRGDYSAAKRDTSVVGAFVDLKF